MRRLIIPAVLVVLLQLQGCATSLETFLAGTLAGTAVGIGAIACVVTCRY